VNSELLKTFLVVHRGSTPYYPRGNGQPESTNKVLRTILTKICEFKRNDSEHKLHAALWAYRTAYKTSTGQIPFQLTYGMEVVMPTEYVLPSLRITIEEKLSDEESLRKILTTVEKLSQARQLTIHAMRVEKMRRKVEYDRAIVHRKDLKNGDLALLYESKKHKVKLKLTGTGPYLVHHINDNGVVLLKTLEGELFPRYINGSRIKRFHAPSLA